MTTYDSQMKESHLENARTVQAGPVSNGKSQHPQGKKVAGAEKNNQHRSKLEPDSLTKLPLRAPLSSKLRLQSVCGPDDNSDLEPLLQFLSSDAGGGANSSPSFPSVTLFLSSWCFKISGKIFFHFTLFCSTCCIRASVSLLMLSFSF